MSNLVRKYYALAENGRALDLGAYSPENAIFLAKQGFDVTALCYSQAGLELGLRAAEKSQVAVDFRLFDLKEFRFRKSHYTAIIIEQTFTHIRKSEALTLSQKIVHSLKKQGTLIGASATIDDPAYKELRRKKALMVESNCFALPNKWVYSFFDRRELLNIFPKLRILYYGETNYYAAPPSDCKWHGLVEFVFRKE